MREPALTLFLADPGLGHVEELGRAARVQQRRPDLSFGEAFGDQIRKGCELTVLGSVHLRVDSRMDGARVRAS